VIVVDDNADVRAFVRGNLEAHFRVLEAADGEAGLALIRRHRPDLVVSDVMMPGLDGHALCRAVKADDELRHIPVILLTARAEEADVIYGLEGGADDFMTKPFSMRELEVRVINLILSRRELRSRYGGTLVLESADLVIPAGDGDFMKRVLGVIDRHLGDGNFSTDWLADEVGLSRRQVERKVKDITQQTPPELVRRLRLERAAQILEARPGSIAEVAYAVGFKSPAHFSVAFRKAYGHTPTQHIDNAT
jgi:CheY-like chemotaxis protein